MDHYPLVLPLYEVAELPVERRLMQGRHFCNVDGQLIEMERRMSRRRPSANDGTKYDDPAAA